MYFWGSTSTNFVIICLKRCVFTGSLKDFLWNFGLYFSSTYPLLTLYLTSTRILVSITCHYCAITLPYSEILLRYFKITLPYSELLLRYYVENSNGVVV